MILVCSKCNKEKESKEFYPSKHWRNNVYNKGYDNVCKECRKTTTRNSREKKMKKSTYLEAKAFWQFNNAIYDYLDLSLGTGLGDFNNSNLIDRNKVAYVYFAQINQKQHEIYFKILKQLYPDCPLILKEIPHALALLKSTTKIYTAFKRCKHNSNCFMRTYFGELQQFLTQNKPQIPINLFKEDFPLGTKSWEWHFSISYKSKDFWSSRCLSCQGNPYDKIDNTGDNGIYYWNPETNSIQKTTTPDQSTETLKENKEEKTMKQPEPEPEVQINLSKPMQFNTFLDDEDIENDD